MKSSVRRAAAAALLAAVLALLWPPGPATAHDGARITVNHDGRGSVWINVTYADGHQVEGPVDATLSAKEADGTTVAPTKMVQSSAPGTLVYLSTLPAGAWDVTVDFGPPIARTCTAAFQVGTSNDTQQSTCDDPITPAAPAPAAERDAGGGNGNTAAWLLIAVAAVAAVVCVIVGVRLRRRRP